MVAVAYPDEKDLDAVRVLLPVAERGEEDLLVPP
jgi:hypothetical protein